MEDGTETLYVRADTGGTSTQLAVMDESGRVFTNKAPTTPDALEPRVRLGVPDLEELFFGVPDADFRRLVAEDEAEHFDVDASGWDGIDAPNGELNGSRRTYVGWRGDSLRSYTSTWEGESCLTSRSI